MSALLLWKWDGPRTVLVWWCHMPAKDSSQNAGFHSVTMGHHHAGVLVQNGY